MELVLKIYREKASRIGVQYVYDYQALQAYEEIIRQAPGETFSATLEPLKDKVKLVLNSDQSGVRFVYPALEYKMEQLLSFRNFYRQGMPLLFMHVYPKKNVLVLAKPFRKETFIVLSTCMLINV